MGKLYDLATTGALVVGVWCIAHGTATGRLWLYLVGAASLGVYRALERDA